MKSGQDTSRCMEHLNSNPHETQLGQCYSNWNNDTSLAATVMTTLRVTLATVMTMLIHIYIYI